MNSDHIVELTEIVGQGLRRPIRKALAAAAVGLLNSARVGIAAIGRRMEGPAQPRSHARRVARLITNPRLEATTVQRGLIGRFLRSHRRTFVCMDWTDHGDFQRLDLSVPTGSRSIPIFWRVYAKRDISEGEGSQNLIEEAFLREFLECLPPRAEVVLLADRGFGRTEFFRFLESIRLSFIIRVKGDTWIRNSQGTFRLKEQKMLPGTVWDLGQVDYRKGSTRGSSIRVRVVTAFGMAAEEPWYLVTNLPDDEIHIAGGYGRRFECEETFRDQKDLRFGFGLRQVRLKEAVRYDRLLTIVALASVMAHAVGVKAESQGLHRILQLNTSKQRQHNLVSLGCYWFRKVRGAVTSLLEGLYRKALSVGRAIFEAPAATAVLTYRERPTRHPSRSSSQSPRPRRPTPEPRGPEFRYLDPSRVRSRKANFRGSWGPTIAG